VRGSLGRHGTYDSALSPPDRIAADIDRVAPGAVSSTTWNAPEAWAHSDRAGNRVCIGAWPYATAGGFAPLNQALHWDGRKWSTVPVPSPAGTAAFDDGELTSARCTSAGNCWAVGDYGTDSQIAIFNLVLHWNGQHWSKFAVQSPGGSGISDFKRGQRPVLHITHELLGSRDIRHLLVPDDLAESRHALERPHVVRRQHLDPDGTRGVAANGLMTSPADPRPAAG
jgi:hypothetical protein